MTTTPVCIAVRTITARLVIRETTPGRPVVYPLLVISKCPWTPPFTAGHAHIHTLCEPGERQYKVAPCNRRPYMIKIGRTP
jgi:hypothetical protein